MHITFRMAVRDMLPEAINQAAQNVSRPLNAEEHRNIRLKMATQLTTPPDPDEELFVLDTADPIRIESIRTDPDGRVDVQLEAFDTDQIADEEAVAVEQLLAAGWEIDVD